MGQKKNNGFDLEFVSILPPPQNKSLSTDRLLSFIGICSSADEALLVGMLTIPEMGQKKNNGFDLEFVSILPPPQKKKPV
ncbi:MAG: hypothetical protein V9E90_04815 [Saprospiraceae bacterium]